MTFLISCDKNVTSSPVFHEDGSRTVLTALPATFGMPIRNETKVILSNEHIKQDV